MDRSKLVWFGMGLLVGLGALLGATMQDGKTTDGRFKVLSVEDQGGKNVIRLDSVTGKSDVWIFAKNKESGEMACRWFMIQEPK